MFFTFLNFYILLSLSIRFNCLWNFVNLCLWVAMDLSFFVFVFMEFCWFVVVGCSGFKFFCFCHFFSLKISTFSSSSSFVVKSVAKKNHKIFVIRFSFSLFFMQFLLDFWFLGILLFGFNSGFVLVDILVFFSSSFYIGLDFLFPFVWLCNFYWIFGFLGFFYFISILPGILLFDLQ